jgi:ABC-type amino acid transport substrate-binding protein
MNISLKLLFSLSILVSISIFPTLGSSNEKTVKIYTSYFPPIVSEDEKRPGFAFEIVKRIFEISEIKYEIIHNPWARSQDIVKKTPEALIFPLTRTKTREEFYNWSFKIFKTQTHFVTINGKKLNKESARNKLIGVQRKSSWDNWLVENNYTKVKRLESEENQLSKMLAMKRIDTWFVEKSVAERNLKNNSFEVTYSDPIMKFETYIATNKTVPYKKINTLKRSFQKLIKSGEYKKILKKYEVLSKSIHQ